MKRVLLLSIFLLIVFHANSHGVIPVIDEASIVQTTLTAFRTLQSNVNEAAVLKNQIDGYVQQAKHLVAVPISYVEDIAAMYQKYNAMLNEAKGIAFTLNNSVNQFETLYDVATHGNISVVQRAQAMLNQIRNASRAATAVTALWEKLCLDQAKVEQLVTISQAAPGTLAAMQAQTQLMAVLSTQQADLARVQATVGRVQVGYIMQQAVAAEQSQANAQQWLATWPAGGFRGPGHGQGRSLPD
jgi:type IV secretion system protein TrbJ